MSSITKKGRTKAVPNVKKRETNSPRKSATKSAAKHSKKNRSSDAHKESGDSLQESEKTARLVELRRKAKSISARHAKTRQQCLAQAIELGQIFEELKKIVGHGPFMDTVREWTEKHGLSICHNTASRYRQYAEMKAAATADPSHKFHNVCNLTEAEAIRKDLYKKSNDEPSETGDPSSDNCPTNSEPQELPAAKVKPLAKSIYRSVLNACASYDKEGQQNLMNALVDLIRRATAQ